LDSQIYPHLGDLAISSISRPPCEIGLGVLEENKLSQNYKTVLFTTLLSIMDSAVEDRLITINPCKANSIRRPTRPSSDIVVWPEDRLRAVQDGLLARFRIICTVGTGCGLRQGEILGLSPDDTDEDGESLYVQRQIRVVDRTLVFALPKAGKKRRVPLSSGVLAAARI
jgi:integrase